MARATSVLTDPVPTDGSRWARSDRFLAGPVLADGFPYFRSVSFPADRS